MRGLCFLVVVTTGWLCAPAGAVRTTTLFPLPIFPDEDTTGGPDQALQLWKAARPCKSRDERGRCVTAGDAAWGPTQEQQFAMSIKDMSEGIRTLLQNTDFTRVWAIIPRTIFIDFPQATILGNFLGLQNNSWAAAIAAVLVFGWPFLLFALYVSLIVLYPNRRSGSDFEKTVSSMVQSWSHMLYKAEDHFLNFLEDMTDPGHHGHHSRIDHDSNDPQVIYFGPIDHYDDHGNAGKSDFQKQDHIFFGVPPGSFDTHRHVSVDDEEWTGEITRMTNAIGFLKVPPKPIDIHGYVSVEDEDKTGGITRMTNVFGFHNDIPDAEKIKHLNVVLGGTYQHGTDVSQAHLGDATGLAPPHEALHPQPHILYHPHSHPPATLHEPDNKQSPFAPTRGPGVIRFEDAPSSPRDGLPHPRFRPSPLVEESLQDDWVAAEHPGVTSDETE